MSAIFVLSINLIVGGIWIFGQVAKIVYYRKYLLTGHVIKSEWEGEWAKLL
jgi:hypothetical protein